MKMTMTAVALGLLLTAPASAATIVTNGSFEDGALALNGSGWNVFNSVIGWNTISGSGIEIQTNPTLGQIDAQEGNRYVELDSNNNSAMRQVVNLSAGDYLLSFWYAPRVGNPGTDGISFSIANAIGSIATSLNPIDGWTLVTAAFSTAGGALNLDFAATGKSESLGGLVDNISIAPAPVPVPAAGLMLVGALGGLAALRRRKA